MAGFDEDHFNSVAVITLDPNATNSIIRLNYIVLKHIDSCKFRSNHVHFKETIVLVIL
jgi:hypothetical protein